MGLFAAQKRWAQERSSAKAAVGRRAVLGDNEAGRLIAEGWTVERAEVALVNGVSSGVLIYHMRAPGFATDAAPGAG